MGNQLEAGLHVSEAFNFRNDGDCRNPGMRLAAASVALRQAEELETAKRAFAELTEVAVAEQTIAKMGQVAVER